MKQRLANIQSKIIARFRGLDRHILHSIFIIILFGVFLTFAASPATAERNHLASYHFIKRQFLFLPIAIVMMFATALMSVKQIRRWALFILITGLIGMVAVLIFGNEIKGARRWLNFGPIGWQPSEFVKPAFAVVCAWMLAVGKLVHRFPGKILAFILYGTIASLLMKQPDIGMLLTITAIYLLQVFISGISKLMILFLGGGLIGLSGIIYLCFEHVQTRVNRFFMGEKAYQVETSMETLQNAGWFGTGPGEGVVKYQLPDAHTDFILAVSAEEFGFILTTILVSLFGFIVLRGFAKIRKENNYFCQIAVAGLLTQIAFQVIVNMGSTLNILPTKGMTLPFVSYGGSSLVSVGLCFGFILGLMQQKTLSKGLD